jgi:hypothetical protein
MDVDEEDDSSPSSPSSPYFTESDQESTSPTPLIQVRQDPDKKRLLGLLMASIVGLVHTAVYEHVRPLYNKTPYHTSALSGEAWVQEVLTGHPERIRCELGVHKHVFLGLMDALVDIGIRSSRNVTLQEQLAIFLYTCVTGLSIRHVGERFQRSNDTISKYFLKMLGVFSHPPFYTNNVCLPKSNDPIPDHIWKNPKFFPFFEGARGALDGTHINCAPTSAERQACRNRKGGVTQNCLAVCSFDLLFLYVCSGWEGSAADSTMYNDARLTDLMIPAGQYYLADAGFPSCASLLVPYRGVRYHLAEWGRGDLR